ncbi:MAG: hypothetical protein JO028_21290 [Acidobacteriaceae bacterium]|nr:hypothetical protein [Acidobacteriaceae bacterium]
MISALSSLQLQFEAGTLILEGADQVTSVPDAFRWDQRIERWRAPAWVYADSIRRVLKVKDEAEQVPSPGEPANAAQVYARTSDSSRPRNAGQRRRAEHDPTLPQTRLSRLRPSAPANLPQFHRSSHAPGNGQGQPKLRPEV